MFCVNTSMDVGLTEIVWDNLCLILKCTTAPKESCHREFYFILSYFKAITLITLNRKSAIKVKCISLVSSSLPCFNGKVFEVQNYRSGFVLEPLSFQRAADCTAVGNLPGMAWNFGECFYSEAGTRSSRPHNVGFVLSFLQFFLFLCFPLFTYSDWWKHVLGAFPMFFPNPVSVRW